MKIVNLAHRPLTDTLFDAESIQTIKSYGTWKQNEDDRAPDAQRVKQLINGADIVITSWGTPNLTSDILDAAPHLKLIIHAAGSVKPIVNDEVYNRGILVISNACSIAIGVAETTLGLTIYSLKHVRVLNENIHAGEWSKDKEQVREMYKNKIGVVGAGWVGRHLIKLLQSFDVQVLLYDPYVDEKEATAMGAKKVQLDAIMRECDVVSLHAPSIDATKHMINASNLRLMKDGATLINTARGSLINEEDLVRECKTGRISACLDVTDPEPPAADHPFRQMSNVILTPHIAGTVTNGRFRIGDYTAHAIGRFLQGEIVPGRVNRDELSKMA